MCFFVYDVILAYICVCFMTSIFLEKVFFKRLRQAFECLGDGSHCHYVYFWVSCNSPGELQKPFRFLSKLRELKLVFLVFGSTTNL